MDDGAGAIDRVRVSDAEREAVVVRLNSATAEGRLTLEEFGERAGQAYGARTAGELARLVDDLPAAAPAVDRTVGSGGRDRRAPLSPIGSVKRSGRWRLERDTRIGTIMGSVKLDLRQAEVAAAEVELHVQAIVGSVKLWVPHGVRVEISGRSYVGSRKIQENSPARHDAPLLRLVVDTVVGSVKIYRT